MVNVMKIGRETVEKVLALFDEEDIPYIHSDKMNDSEKKEVIGKIKVKTLGGKNDRPRE